MKQKLKRFMAGFMAMLTLVGTRKECSNQCEHSHKSCHKTL